MITSVLEKIYNSNISYDQKTQLSSLVLATQSLVLSSFQDCVRLQEKLQSILISPECTDVYRRSWLSLAKNMNDTYTRNNELLSNITKDIEDTSDLSTILSKYL